MKIFMGGIVLICYCLPVLSYSQDKTDTALQVIRLPAKFLQKVDSKTRSLDRSLSAQTDKYLSRISRREQRMAKLLSRVDPNAARALFGNSPLQYAALSQKLRSDTGNFHVAITGEYQPYADSLQGMLGFLQKTPNLAIPSGLGGAERQLQGLEAKMQDVDQIKDFIKQRRQQIGDYISQHTSLAGSLGKEYQGMNQDLYYYSQQVRQYKEMLNDPDKLTSQALAILNKLPAFQAFMKQNSQLAGLFNLPTNYSDPASLAGLQTRDQVSTLISNQVAAGGAGGAAALQANLQSAQGQLNAYKDKLNQLGGGSGDIDMPNFKPNNQRTKPFWKRLEYETNFQTSRSTYYFPTVTDLGLSVGYKFDNRTTIGIGVSYKLGWGNGWNHIALSSQGVGLRSFFDTKLKGSFFVSGGFEYNYNTPFRSMQQLHNWADWSRSGLAGVSKIISVKSRVFKKTKLSLLWDFLSYQQVPKTQPILFRVGYHF